MNVNKDSQGVRLAIKVTPNASRNEITDFKDGVLQLKIAAPPLKGKANKEIIDFLSRVLGVKKSSIAIIRGLTSRNKIIAIEDISHEELLKRISA